MAGRRESWVPGWVQGNTNGKVLAASPELMTTEKTMLQCKGWLSEKQAGSALHLYSKRWCVLDGQQLFIYDSIEEANPIKVLNLPQFQVRMIVRDKNICSEDDDDETDPRANQEEYILELKPRQTTSRKSDVYMFATETEEEFSHWGKMLSIGAKPKKSDSLEGPKDNNMQSRESLSPDDVFIEVPSFTRTQSEPSQPNHDSKTLMGTSIDVKLSPGSSSPAQKRGVARTVSAPFSPYTQQHAKSDFLDILKRADFTFWEEEENKSVTLPRRSLESCLLAPSTKKSPCASPVGSPSMPRRAEARYTSLPPNIKIQSPTTQRSKKSKSPRVSPSGSPSLRQKVSKKFGASRDRNSWGGGGSPKMSPILNRKSWGLGSELSKADFDDCYGMFESRSAAKQQEGGGKVDGNGNIEFMSKENPVVSILLMKDEDLRQETPRPRSATISSSSSNEDQTVGLKAPTQFNRTLSFITRMKEANKRKRKARQIAITADDIVNPVKTGFVKIGSKAKRFYAVLKDEWLYLYKKPTDTCTVDAYDMPSYVVSANVGADSIRNIRNQKLSISLEHKMTGDVTVMTAEVGIEIFDWAEKLQKASKDQGLQMAGLNLEQGMSRKKPVYTVPTMHQEESSSQSESRDDQLAELHRHRLIQEAMKENQQLILGTQTLKESPEQFPLKSSESPSLQRKREKLESKFMKASEEEEQQAMRDMTLLKRRRISTQVKQDTILRQLEGRKQKKNKKQREEGEAMMRKQLDELNAKLSTINSEIKVQSQHKEQKLQAIKERKALELQVLEQQNQLLRYRRATQEALENIMENAPIQRMSVPFSDESSDANSDTDSPREERSDSQTSQLSGESVPGISLQRPSIDAGVPGPTVIIQRSSIELQIGPAIQEEPLQSQNASVESQNAPLQGDSSKGGSEQAKTKRRLLPAIPGSPHSSRSNSRSNTPSGSESENELKIVESSESKREKFRDSIGSNSGIEVSGASLVVPGSGHSSPTTSDSGSESPHVGRYRKNSKGRSLPNIPSTLSRSSKDSSSSMDIASDESPEMNKKLPSGHSSNHINSSVDVIANSNHRQSDSNGNMKSTQMIYLRHTEGKVKTKPRPMSEGADMHRLKVPEKKKQRSASDSQGFRTEVSPDVLRDIEEFERMARKALREAGWQIPI